MVLTWPRAPCPAILCPQGVALRLPSKGVGQTEKEEGHTPGDPSTTLEPELCRAAMGDAT